MSTLQQRQAQVLIARLAYHLGRFRTKRRSHYPPDILHIGWDMELCTGSADPKWSRPCSERCMEVNALIGLAAHFLGMREEDLLKGALPATVAAPRRARRPSRAKSASHTISVAGWEQLPLVEEA